VLTIRVYYDDGIVGEICRQTKTTSGQQTVMDLSPSATWRVYRLYKHWALTCSSSPASFKV